ncbi:fibrous sheath CABYR-binding protein-like [Macadamia integrifolia]|uniref:fibrous sheath CABYR-binding protein-like n=1 Tax=Macadamia integrifolia TaxID=60698 RepID=UPI001C52C1A9|nr:fibrous sheath CABYR-binding protein-like [Macadamia integrifolia]
MEEQLVLVVVVRHNPIQGATYTVPLFIPSSSEDNSSDRLESSNVALDPKANAGPGPQGEEPPTLVADYRAMLVTEEEKNSAKALDAESPGEDKGDLDSGEGNGSASSFGPRKAATLILEDLPSEILEVHHERFRILEDVLDPQRLAVASAKAWKRKVTKLAARRAKEKATKNRDDRDKGPGGPGASLAEVKRSESTPLHLGKRPSEDENVSREKDITNLRSLDKGKGPMGSPLARRDMGDDLVLRESSDQPLNQFANPNQEGQKRRREEEVAPERESQRGGIPGVSLGHRQPFWKATPLTWNLVNEESSISDKFGHGSELLFKEEPLLRSERLRALPSIACVLLARSSIMVEEEGEETPPPAEETPAKANPPLDVEKTPAKKTPPLTAAKTAPPPAAL